MSHESTPQLLSTEEQAQLDKHLAEAEDVATEAWSKGANTRSYEDSSISRRFGSLHGDSTIRKKPGRIDFEVDRNRGDNEFRNAHAYTDTRTRSLGESHNSVLHVKRNGERKTLRSENPLVYKMIAEMAIKGVKQESQAELEAHQARKAA